MLLLIVASAGIAVLSIAIRQSLLSTPSLNAELGSSLNRLSFMAAASCIAGFVVALISVAILRYERRRLRRLQGRFSQLLLTADQASDLVTILDRKGRIEYVNRAVEVVTGYPKQELLGRKFKPGIPWYADPAAFEDMLRTVGAGLPFRRTLSGRKHDGSLFIIKEHVAPLPGPRGRVTRFVSTARDVTRWKHAEERLNHLSRYDPLTGVPNRRHFAHLLKEELGEKRPVDWLLSVLILDIDRFKYINDIFGPEVGDEILKRITEILGSVVSEHDIVARLGSDEFGVIHRYDAAFVDTTALAERIRTAVSQRIAIAGQDIAATATIGIASFPDNGRDARMLLKNADMALSRAKALGRNTVQFYSREMEDQISSFYVMERRLIGALRQGEYLVHYQPYWDLTTKRVNGAEALIRWHNGELGCVSPSTFIPVLEETGLIVDVGEWVLRTACRQNRDWKSTNRALSVSVNLSLAQFRHRNLVGMISESLRETKIDPSQLTLELTESICIQDIDFTITILKKLKDLGVSISIDDFGTGYSSLSYIKRLPVDTLKIDRSFIHDVSRDPDAASIVTAITSMARSLGLKTIAEGVESEEQRNILHILRCDMGQGHYFSPAVDAADFQKMLV
jgi:diguanylate cyclase (GGDEF)-like protein/PAS domain S-box-containing protein